MYDPEISTLVVRCASLPRVQGDKKNYRHRGKLRDSVAASAGSGDGFQGHSFFQRNLDDFLRIRPWQLTIDYILILGNM